MCYVWEIIRRMLLEGLLNKIKSNQKQSAELNLQNIFLVVVYFWWALYVCMYVCISKESIFAKDEENDNLF